MSYWNRKKDGTDFYMNVVFKYEEKEVTQEVEIPFDSFIEAVVSYVERYKDIKLDGKDTDIWNFLVDIDGLDKIAEDEDFLDICREVYYDSYQFELDKEEWEDEYESEHYLGKYSNAD